jgi:hypothetical protein
MITVNIKTYRLLGMTVFPSANHSIYATFINFITCTAQRRAFFARSWERSRRKCSAAMLLSQSPLTSNQNRLILDLITNICQVSNHQYFVLNCATSSSIVKIFFPWLWLSWSPSGLSSQLVSLYVFFSPFFVRFVTRPSRSIRELNKKRYELKNKKG